MSPNNKMNSEEVITIKKRTIGRKLLCLVVLFFVSVSLLNSTVLAVEDSAKIILRLEKAEVLQEQELPQFVIQASVIGDQEIILDEEYDYTVENLVEDFYLGKGFQVSGEVDLSKEGEYPLELVLTQELEEKILKDWLGKVTISSVAGTIEVKNKYGYWEGDVFKDWEGNIRSNAFVAIQGETFFLDEEGHKATGWHEIDGASYHFDQEGLGKEGWYKEDDTYYLTAEGKTLVGWQEIEGNTYYFDSQGRMYTGERIVGLAKCTFSEEGVFLSSVQWLDQDKPMVALTFDDGPGKHTKRLLEALKENNARATFFMLGNNIGGYADLLKEMVLNGCELGNHSKNHPQLTKLSVDRLREQIDETNQKIEHAAGKNATVMRPPFGEVNQTVQDNISMPLIMWSIDTLDWKTKDKDLIVKAMTENIRDGDIILLHDIHSFSVDAAIEAIPILIEQGYQLVTVTELAEAKGISLSPGEKYFSFYQ